MFEIINQDGKARIGKLHTKKGIAETPFFMPVSTKMTPKHINSMQLNKMKIPAVISNAFILSMRPGSKFVEKMGGIGKMMNFNGLNFTDSGGFQMYSKSIYHNSNDSGIYFKNPFTNQKIFMTPEENMKIQLELGSDVAMCLDSMPMYEESYEDIKEAVRKTIKWAKKCKKTHDSLKSNFGNPIEKTQSKSAAGENESLVAGDSKTKNQLLFGITQGGKYEDLRKECINELLKLDFEGYSIGGFGLGESREEEQKIIKLHKEMLPDEKPIYLMGIGDPVEILEAINLGCDIFDSRLPTQNARRGSLFTSKGKLRILRKEFEFDDNPIDNNCKCFVCKNYTKSYIRYLLKEQESVGKELASYHNIYFLNNMINEVKIAIKENRFQEFLNNFKKEYVL
ncbi:MAG TPA: tRNA guanosine(34) transglycosylase Tgt [Candidatus Pacearchaeota archaeon]|nr:tRNA guanosine(34) transglycosylase Tgt [Candidatus Pacearchaeota archaeon]